MLAELTFGTAFGVGILMLGALAGWCMCCSGVMKRCFWCCPEFTWKSKILSLLGASGFYILALMYYSVGKKALDEL